VLLSGADDAALGTINHVDVIYHHRVSASAAGVVNWRGRRP